MGGAVSALVVFGTLVLVGAPIALSIRGVQPEWTGLAFESAVIGLLVELFVAIVLTHARYYSLPAALALTLVVVGGSALAMQLVGARRGTPGADLSLLRDTPELLIGLATLALVVVALQIRHSPSYFIFQTADMGGYVNSANILTRGGTHYGIYPHGFTLFLRETNLLLGKANTVAGLPALGAILLLGVVAFARAAKLHVAVAFGLGFLVLVHPATVWFSLLPVSETLAATLVVALLYLVVRARSNASHAYAVIAGFVAGALLLVRGEAMLLAPILVVLLLASAAVDDAVTAAVHRRFTIVALVTLFASYAYDAHYSHSYFRGQLNHLLPGPLFDFAEKAHLIELSVVLFLAGAIALALVLGADWLVTRHVRPHTVTRPATFWRYAYAAVVAVTAIALVFFPLAGLGDALMRWGLLLLALFALGVASVVYRPGKHLDATCGLLFLLVIGVYSVLFARRVHVAQAQATYLYFDRYLFGLMFPAALLVSAIGVQRLVEIAARLAHGSRAARVAVAALVLILVAGLYPQIHETRRVGSRRLLGESYAALSRLDVLTQRRGVGVIVYSGLKTRPKNWLFPNTYRAFALPLQQSFGRQVLGIQRAAQDKDNTFNPPHARRVLARKGYKTGYLVALRRDGHAPYPDDEHTQLVGTVWYSCPTLGQNQNWHSPVFRWRVARFRVDVYALS